MIQTALGAVIIGTSALTTNQKHTPSASPVASSLPQNQTLRVASRPGTMSSSSSASDSKANLVVLYTAEAAAALLAVIDGLAPTHSGSFFDYRGDYFLW